MRDGCGREPFVMSRHVEFSDLDAYGVCHFSRLADFFETSTFEGLARQGVLKVLEARKLEFRLVDVRISFSHPARFRDEIEITTRICCHARKKTRLVARNHACRPAPDGPGSLLAEGIFEIVLVRRDKGELVRIPPEIRELLGDAAPPDGLQAA